MPCKLHYEHPVLASNSHNADYRWCEIGDAISFDNNDALYCCFPGKHVSVTKARIAAELLFQMKMP